MRSFTIVGDIAQSSSASGGRSWEDAVGPLFRGHWRLEQLTVNYRTPAQIARVAEDFARSRGLPITPARAVREGDWPVREVRGGAAAALAVEVAPSVRVANTPSVQVAKTPSAQVANSGGVEAEESQFVRLEGGDEAGRTGDRAGRPIGLAAATVDAVAHDRAIDDSGTLAVIVPVALAADVAEAVAARFGADAGRGAAGLVKPIVELTAHDAKGLEFDAVVIVDPDGIVAESPRGASALYVAMTRPTQRLTLVRP